MKKQLETIVRMMQPSATELEQASVQLSKGICDALDRYFTPADWVFRPDVSPAARPYVPLDSQQNNLGRLVDYVQEFCHGTDDLPANDLPISIDFVERFKDQLMELRDHIEGLQQSLAKDISVLDARKDAVVLALYHEWQEAVDRFLAQTKDAIRHMQLTLDDFFYACDNTAPRIIYGSMYGGGGGSGGGGYRSAGSHSSHLHRVNDAAPPAAEKNDDLDAEMQAFQHALEGVHGSAGEDITDLIAQFQSPVNPVECDIGEEAYSDWLALTTADETGSDKKTHGGVFPSAQDTPVPAAEPQTPALDQLEITAVSPSRVAPGEYGIVDVVLCEEAYRSMIDLIADEQTGGGKKTHGGVFTAAQGTPVRVVLTSPDATVDEPEETQIWRGKYLRFSFDFAVPEGYGKRQVLLRAAVYFADVPATRLRILIDLDTPAKQQATLERRDVNSAFMSYASVERDKVIRIMQGIQQVRPDLDLFLDVDRLRSGENWEARLLSEIDRRDVLYLCWSPAAKESPYVAMEWKHALEQKGAQGVEPIPLVPASQCPPPPELSHLHFSNRLLFFIPESKT